MIVIVKRPVEGGGYTRHGFHYEPDSPLMTLEEVAADVAKSLKLSSVMTEIWIEFGSEFVGWRAIERVSADGDTERGLIALKFKSRTMGGSSRG